MFFNYHLIIVPLLALVFAQLVKLIINWFSGDFSWQKFNQYGGMPSSHSALVFALSTEIGSIEGWHSVAFAVSFILLIIVIRDAVGFRRYLGRHGKVLNMLIKELPDKKESKFPHLEEKLGHSVLEVTIGAMVGIIVALII